MYLVIEPLVTIFTSGCDDKVPHGVALKDRNLFVRVLEAEGLNRVPQGGRGF